MAAGATAAGVIAAGATAVGAAADALPCSGTATATENGSENGMKTNQSIQLKLPLLPPKQRI